MKSLRTDIQLLPPNVNRDAPFAHSWFTRPEGSATLLSMGNTASEIQPSTINSERSTIQEFIDLEKNGKQITRAIINDRKAVGFVWIELIENHSVKPPSIHIIIGDPDYRGKGIGRSALESAIQYVHEVLMFNSIYSRHLKDNTTIKYLLESLGFIKDGSTYRDHNELIWQNVILMKK